MMTHRYIAVWHDRAAIIAATKDNEDEESAFDYAERHESTREFTVREAAISFLVEYIKAGKDFFGQCEIREMESMTRRCRACTCGGWQVTGYLSIDDDGICGTSASDSECI